MIKRRHKKSHGVASFQEIARVVAEGWKTIDRETLSFCTNLAAILKQRYNILKSSGGLESFLGLAQSCATKDLDGIASTDSSTCTLRNAQSLDELRNRHSGGACFVPGAVPRLSDSFTTIHSEVDIPDNDIVAMWLSD